MKRVLDWLRGLTAPRVVITRTSTRPMTDADWQRFDAAFEHMDRAFAELAKIK